MIFGTVCSGIGAPEAAWKPLGWRCAFMSEIEPFPRAVLAHHYPDVPLHGDFTTIQAGDYEPIELLCGGTPCQSFSVAGLRGGMADERGNLALEFLRLADRLRPRWVVWENVPGVRSSGGGRDFGAFLGGLGELGYGWAYRSLDAQYAGLAQRRERVFVVGYLGDWRPAAAVLFEPASLRGDPAPRRETGQSVAPTVARGSPGGRTYGLDADTADSLIAGTLQASGKAAGSATQQDAEAGLLLAYGGNNTSGPIDDATALNASHTASGRQDFETETFIAHTLRAEGFDASEDGTGRGVPLVCGTLTSNGDAHSGFKDEHGPVAFGWQNSASQGDSTSVLTFPTLDKSKTPAIAFDLAQITSAANRTRAELGLPASAMAKGSQMHVSLMAAVRRLTPRECERLQGFPDDFTLVPYRRGMAADGPRYRALGNSMAVPVLRWIGRRISDVDSALMKNC